MQDGKVPEIDVNKCAADTYLCCPHGACTDINASYKFTCGAGYAGHSFTCSDINDCIGADACGVNAACDKIAGSHVGTCNTGYSGNGQTGTDGDECVSSDNTGHTTLASCTNIDGSY